MLMMLLKCRVMGGFFIGEGESGREGDLRLNKLAAW